jgi:hypothetical protein
MGSIISSEGHLGHRDNYAMFYHVSNHYRRHLLFSRNSWKQLAGSVSHCISQHHWGVLNMMSQSCPFLIRHGRGDAIGLYFSLVDWENRCSSCGGEILRRRLFAHTACEMRVSSCSICLGEPNYAVSGYNELEDILPCGVRRGHYLLSVLGVC